MSVIVSVKVRSSFSDWVEVGLFKIQSQSLLHGVSVSVILCVGVPFILLMFVNAVEVAACDVR